MEEEKMKKLLAVLLALVMVLSLVACGQEAAAPADEGGDAAAPAGNADIGISMPTKSLERWNRDGSYLKEQFGGRPLILAGYSLAGCSVFPPKLYTLGSFNSGHCKISKYSSSTWNSSSEVLISSPFSR